MFNGVETSTSDTSFCTRAHTFKYSSEAFENVKDISIVHERGRGIAWRIWPAAHILVEWLEKNKAVIKSEPTHVVEIGAGVGMVGVCCAALGADLVTLTDLDEALPALARTAEANPGLSEKLRVARLFFGHKDDMRNVVQSTESRLIIVGSDLVYFESLFLPLAETMRELCYEYDATVYLAYKKRIWKNEKRFFSKILEQHGLKAEVVFETIVEEQDGLSQAADGRVQVAEGLIWNSRIFKISRFEDNKDVSAPVVELVDEYDWSQYQQGWPSNKRPESSRGKGRSG